MTSQVPPTYGWTAAAKAFSDPGHVLRCVILDAIKMFIRNHDGVEPDEIWLTPEMEALLVQHINLDGSSDESSYAFRERGQLLGMKVHFDSGDFKLANGPYAECPHCQQGPIRRVTSERWRCAACGRMLSRE